MRIWKWRVLMFVLAAAVGGFTLTLLAVGEDSFELDGNAVYDGYHDDWATLKAGGGSAFTWTGIKPDMHTASADPTAFFSNQTKDTVDIPNNWTWKSTSVPDKDDLNNAYAAAYIDPYSGHTIITFGADRYSAGNGTAYLGFWFFQANVGPVGTGQGAFSGQHVENDMLVLVNFSGGGSHPQVQVLKWVNSAGDVSEHLKMVYQDNDALCGPGSGTACAITNTAAVTLSWPFAYKNSPSCTNENGPCTAPELAFFEGAVDLDEVFPGALPCITSFLAETRSSDSPTADLKDFVTDSFSLCGIGIEKACGTATAGGSSVTYNNTITVKNTGSGVLYDALVTDTYQTGATTNATRRFAANCSGLSNCVTVAALASLAPKGQAGSSVTIPETFTAPLLSATDSATADAAPAAGVARTITTPVPASATCSASVTPAVLVTKECEKVELVQLNSMLVVKVTVKGTIKNDSAGTNITITSITDDPVVASIPLGTNTLGLGQSTTFGPFSYYPSAVSIGACDSGTVCFTDVVTVGWAAVLGGATGTNTGQATCSLCKPGCLTGYECKAK
jgi:hypothetical protein